MECNWFEPKISEEDRGCFEIVAGTILIAGGMYSAATGSILGTIAGVGGGGAFYVDGVCRVTKDVSAYQLIRKGLAKASSKLANIVNQGCLYI